MIFASVSCFVSPRKGDAPLRLSTQEGTCDRRKVDRGGGGGLREPCYTGLGGSQQPGSSLFNRVQFSTLHGTPPKLLTERNCTFKGVEKGRERNRVLARYSPQRNKAQSNRRPGLGMHRTEGPSAGCMGELTFDIRCVLKNEEVVSSQRRWKSF